jgi:cell division protein FtsI/penicillin-binding protein 2
MVQAFSSFARQGELSGTLPQLHMIAESAGTGSKNPTVIYRVLPPDIARLAREPMAGVVASMEERWCKSPDESVPQDKNAPHAQWQYRLFGKSGTAEIPLGKAPDGKMAPPGSTGYFDNQYNSSFIAAGPIENPRLVCLVVIDDPGPQRVRARSHYGAAAAGPVVRRVMEKALAYVGAPVSVREEAKPDSKGLPAPTPVGPVTR